MVLPLLLCYLFLISYFLSLLILSFLFFAFLCSVFGRIIFGKLVLGKIVIQDCSMITKKTSKDWMSQSIKVSFYAWTNYSIGWAFCPLTGYFTLPFNKKICCGTKPLILSRGKSHSLQSNAPGYIFIETSAKMPPFNVQFSW